MLAQMACVSSWVPFPPISTLMPFLCCVASSITTLCEPVRIVKGQVQIAEHLCAALTGSSCPSWCQKWVNKNLAVGTQREFIGSLVTLTQFTSRICRSFGKCGVGFVRAKPLLFDCESWYYPYGTLKALKGAMQILTIRRASTLTRLSATFQHGSLLPSLPQSYKGIEVGIDIFNFLPVCAWLPDKQLLYVIDKAEKTRYGRK